MGSSSVNTNLYDRLFNKSALKGGANNKSGILSLLMSKRKFLILTFANLIVQLGITYYIFIQNNKKMKDKKLTYQFWVLCISLFIVLFLMVFNPFPSWVKFLLFCVFSGLEGYLLSYIKYSDAINIALLGTLSIFGSMMLFGFLLIVLGINLTKKFGFFLFILLLLLIILMFFNLFLTTFTLFNKILSILGLLLFSVYVLYDTNTILQKNYYGDFITASLDFYLDFINIFLNLLNLN